MRALCDMDTIQIEITNACNHNCGNCTRFCHHVQKPFFMDFETFKTAVDSMAKYPKMTGMMGGEPLLHPQFEEFCEYMKSKLPKRQLGLWTSLPPGKERYAKTIVDTFDHVFINDHSRDDVYHAPVLVGIEEIYKDPREMFYVINHCWAQMSWSASINQKGTFFCEIAASMAMLFDEGDAWPIEPGWWWRTPKDFREQIEHYCPRCGLSVPLPRRKSVDSIDDISQKNYERLVNRSKKIAKGEYKISDLVLSNCPEPMASYKDTAYRNRIASRYGMYLVVNDMGFWTPYIVDGTKQQQSSIFDEIKRTYGG